MSEAAEEGESEGPPLGRPGGCGGRLSGRLSHGDVSSGKQEARSALGAQEVSAGSAGGRRTLW